MSACTFCGLALLTAGFILILLAMACSVRFSESSRRVPIDLAVGWLLLLLVSSVSIAVLGAHMRNKTFHADILERSLCCVRDATSLGRAGPSSSM
jgi:hypothetical protein